MVKLKHALTIIYLDQDLVAVHKPHGISVHRSAESQGDKRWLVQLLRNQIKQRVYPVHRLDRPTSGLLLMALNPRAAQRLCDAFSGSGFQKTYVCIVRGYIPESGLIDHPLRSGDGQAKSARTQFMRLGLAELPFAVGPHASARYSLVEVSPLTGRRHQIRRHLRHIAHPIIGDTMYGDSRQNHFFQDHFNCKRLLLAAVELGFLHPATGRPLTLTAPLDESVKRIIDQLGWASHLPPLWLSNQRNRLPMTC